jgi:hypothetical protein
MTDAEKTLATQLTLLFDGKGDDEIAKAMAQALPGSRAENVCWSLCWHAGINISVAVSPTDILNRLGDFGDGEEVFVGTHDDLARHCKAHEWGDLGDYFADAMDDVIEGLKDEGLIEERGAQP